MAEDVEERRLLRPIVNASYPATVAALSLAVSQIIGAIRFVRVMLGLGALMFMICAFAFFFYTLYPAHRKLWTVTAPNVHRRPRPLPFIFGFIAADLTHCALAGITATQDIDDYWRKPANEFRDLLKTYAIPIVIVIGNSGRRCFYEVKAQRFKSCTSRLHTRSLSEADVRARPRLAGAER